MSSLCAMEKSQSYTKIQSYQHALLWKDEWDRFEAKSSANQKKSEEVEERMNQKIEKKELVVKRRLFAKEDNEQEG